MSTNRGIDNVWQPPRFPKWPSKPILMLPGSDGKVLKLAQGLLHIALWSVIFFDDSVVLSGTMRASGTVWRPMATTLPVIILVQLPLDTEQRFPDKQEIAATDKPPCPGVHALAQKVTLPKPCAETGSQLATGMRQKASHPSRSRGNDVGPEWKVLRPSAWPHNNMDRAWLAHS